MDIGLVTRIPDELRAWGVESVVKRDRELGHAQARPEVPTLLGYDVDVSLTHRVDHLTEALGLEPA